MLEQSQEHTRLVARGSDGAGQHQRGVERPHVAVVDVAHHPLNEHVGVAAGKRPRRAGYRERVPQPHILAHHQRVNACGRAAHADVLVGVGEHLGLDERAARQQVAEAARLSHVVFAVLHDPLRVRLEDARDLRPLDVDPPRARQSEVQRGLFEAVSRQGAVRHVVRLQHEERIHHVPAGDLEAVVGDRALAEADAAGAAPRHAAVATELERNLPAGGALGEVRQVEVEDVMPLDHVRVALADEAHKLPQHVALVVSGSGDDLRPAGAVAEGNGDDPVSLALGVAELIAGRGVALDIHLQAAHVLELHAAEQGPPGQRQVLVDGVVDEQVGRVWRAGRAARGPGEPVPGRKAVRPGPEHRQQVDGIGALEGPGLELNGAVGDCLQVGGNEAA